MGCIVNLVTESPRHPALFFEGTSGIYLPREREEVLHDFCRYLSNFYHTLGMEIESTPRFQKKSARNLTRRYFPVHDLNGNHATDVVIEDLVDGSHRLREDPGRDYGASLSVRPIAKFIAYFNSKRDEEFVKRQLRNSDQQLNHNVASLHDHLSYKQRDMFYRQLPTSLKRVQRTAYG
jgi:hypothetical protein